MLGHWDKWKHVRNELMLPHHRHKQPVGMETEVGQIASFHHDKESFHDQESLNSNSDVYSVLAKIKLTVFFFSFPFRLMPFKQCLLFLFTTYAVACWLLCLWNDCIDWYNATATFDIIFHCTSHFSVRQADCWKQNLCNLFKQRLGNLFEKAQNIASRASWHQC